MADLELEEKCSRCGGDGYVAVGAIRNGLSATKTCPLCHGTGTYKTEEPHSHFAPTELRK